MKINKLIKKLDINYKLVDECREFSKKIVDEVFEFIKDRTTVTVERAVLRLFGVEWFDQNNELPYVNVIVEKLKNSNLLSKGATYIIFNIMILKNIDLKEACELIIKEKINLKELQILPKEIVYKKAIEYAKEKSQLIKNNVNKRNELIEKLGEGKPPYLYLIVATGNIFEDVIQAQNAARAGADIIAVIRSTAQSLLDYVPHGATTEGFGGTYATQENFKIMRKALDEVSFEIKKYIRLVNYCSGLCMPEIAALGAIERLDVMLNDSMYGILFRDINMQRTFIDQYFSRMINSYADIVINTGEDNYLTTSDAFEKAHTVVASQFINERFAMKALMPKKLMGLGHAFEIDPSIPNQFLYELAQAQLIKQIFPDHPLKYMPPTKYMTGNIFKGHVQDALFNAVSIMSGQTIHLLGMLTEAIHTPFMMDRHLSIENAKLVFNIMENFYDEIEYKKDGIIQKRAEEVLENTHKMLKEVSDIGLMNAIEKGMFADIKRTKTGGKGFDGVLLKDKDYFNPFEEIFSKELKEKYKDLDQ
ncbi:MAG: lysine 5,6-aminomutase subunit alpha [Spirochaetes bacterium]|nr:lysine 5,6-aminomutase subunit alpha [Spirochaetota bacterium]